MSTVSISSRGIGRAAIRACLMRSSASPVIWTLSASRASRSSVTLIEPSMEFSIGTIDQSTSPLGTAMTASLMVVSATGSTASGAALLSRASSLKVPSGPR